MTVAVSQVLFAAVGIATLAIASRSGPPPWLINETPSVAPGLYGRVAEPPRPGRFVVVAPPPTAQAYLSACGTPAGRLLLKRVTAVAGERVCSDGHSLVWPGGAVRLRTRDREGRPLPAWRGCRVLRTDEVLALGDSPTSFDSRYFGPVPTTALEGVYREVWTW